MLLNTKSLGEGVYVNIPSWLRLIVDAKQIKYFLALTHFANFRVAAQHCEISQPGLSRQIMALEEEFGAPLFNRTGRGVTLTPIGESFLPHARRVQKELELAEQEIALLLQPERGEVCIAGLHSVNTYLLPTLIAGFRRQYPKTQLRLTSLGSERIIKLLLDRLVDLAIVMGPVQVPELVSTLLYEEDLAILLPAQHPLAYSRQVTLAQVASYPQVVFRDGYAMRSALIRYFAQVGTKPEIAVELNTLEAFKETVRQGVGIALLPVCALQNLSPDLTWVQVQDLPLKRRVELIYRRDHYQIPVVANFGEMLKSQLPQVFENFMHRGANSGITVPLTLVGS